MIINIIEVQPDSIDALQLIGELDDHLLSHPYPPQSRHAFSVDKLLRERVVFFVTYLDGALAGCGGLKMFVRPVHRGKGLGKAMLNHLADYARNNGVNLLRLETGIYEVEAIKLYEGWGFYRRTPFGGYVEDPLSVYLEKRLV
jgi:putative acetyltransferase